MKLPLEETRKALVFRWPTGLERVLQSRDEWSAITLVFTNHNQ